MHRRNVNFLGPRALFWVIRVTQLPHCADVRAQGCAAYSHPATATRPTMAADDGDSRLRMTKYAELLEKATSSPGKSNALELLKFMRRNKVRLFCFAAEASNSAPSLPTNAQVDDPVNCMTIAGDFVAASPKYSVQLDDRELVRHTVCRLPSTLPYFGCPGLAVAEQFIEAALRMGQVEAAAEVYEGIIRPHFSVPDSQRAVRLVGMIFEASGDLEEAERLYSGALKANSANALLHKRLICVAKAAGDTRAVQARLNAYLQVFSQDWSAWLELAELNEAAEKYSFAAYCYEEVVLLQPAQPYPHVKLAECILAQLQQPASPARASAKAVLGAVTQARKHAAHAVHVSNSTYARALWALAIACVSFARVQDEGADPATVVPEGALASLETGAPPSSAHPLDSLTWTALASTTAQGSGASVAVGADVVAKDDNAALFQAAVSGLQALYTAQAAETGATAAKLAELGVPAVVNNKDGGVAGSWGDAAAVLQEWLAFIG